MKISEFQKFRKTWFGQKAEQAIIAMAIFELLILTGLL